ncbi:MAG: hypothetical protein ACPGRZ_02830 [Alphaproteobacteria bacterium]
MEHVFIYAQGTHRFVEGLTIDRLTDGLSGALGKAYRSTCKVDAYRFEGAEIACRTIEKKGDAGWSSNIKILESDYYDIFLGIEAQNLVYRAWQTIGVVFSNIGLAIKPFLSGWRGEQANISSLQRSYISLLVVMNLLVPLVFIVLLVLGAQQVGQQFATTLEAVGTMGAATEKSANESSSIPLIAGSLIGLTALIALFQLIWKNFAPPRLVGFVSVLARDPVCMLMYFVGRPRNNPFRDRIIGRLDKIYRLARSRYPDATIHVVGYSFGAIAAYDWLFPNTGIQRHTDAKTIGGVVTLGLPHEMVATFWPDYFDKDRDFRNTAFVRLHTASLKNDIVGSALPENAQIREHIASPDVTSDLVENNHDEVPSDWTDELSRNPVRKGVEEHGLYFGMADKLESPAFRHCADCVEFRSA